MMNLQWSDLDDFLAKYGYATSPEKYRKFSLVTQYFEGLGVLVKNGFIDAALVDDLISVYIVGFWQKFGPVWKELRVRFNSPTSAEYVEYLYDAVYKIWLQQHPETPTPMIE